MKGLVTPMRSSPKMRARYKVQLRSHFVGHSPSGAWPIGDTDQTFGIDADDDEYRWRRWVLKALGLGLKAESLGLKLKGLRYKAYGLGLRV